MALRPTHFRDDRSHGRSVQAASVNARVGVAPSRRTLSTILLALLASFMIGGAVTACDSNGRAAHAANAAPPTERFTLKDETFDLELAADAASIAKGLGGRDSIADDGGMLFVFPDAQVRQFWMLDCMIDIDVIFVDALGGVTAVHRMKADPQRPGETRADYESRLRRYSSVSRAQFAIELQAGSIDRLGIKPGDRINAEWRRIRRHAR